MILDTGITNETYIEDCEVCCNPIEVSLKLDNGELVAFNAESIEQ